MTIYKYIIIGLNGNYHSIDSKGKDIWVKDIRKAMLHDTRDEADWYSRGYVVKIKRLSFKLVGKIK